MPKKKTHNEKNQELDVTTLEDGATEDMLNAITLSDEVEPLIHTAPVVHHVSGVARLVKNVTFPDAQKGAFPASIPLAYTHIGKCARATPVTSTEARIVQNTPRDHAQELWCAYCRELFPAEQFVWAHNGHPLAGEDA